MSLESTGTLVALSALAAAAKSLALYVGDPTAGGAEVTGTGYARATAEAWTVRTDTVQNTSPIVFAKPTATWGAVTHFRVLNATGNALWYGQLTRAITLDATTPALVLGAGTAIAKIL